MKKLKEIKSLNLYDADKFLLQYGVPEKLVKAFMTKQEEYKKNPIANEKDYLKRAVDDLVKMLEDNDEDVMIENLINTIDYDELDIGGENPINPDTVVSWIQLSNIAIYALEPEMNVAFFDPEDFGYNVIKPYMSLEHLSNNIITLIMQEETDQIPMLLKVVRSLIWTVIHGAVRRFLPLNKDTQMFLYAVVDYLNAVNIDDFYLAIKIIDNYSRCVSTCDSEVGVKYHGIEILSDMDLKTKRMFIDKRILIPTEFNMAVEDIEFIKDIIEDELKNNKSLRYHYYIAFNFMGAIVLKRAMDECIDGMYTLKGRKDE